jgi:hypothetical protein
MRRTIGWSVLAALVLAAAVPARAQDACTSQVMGKCQAAGGDMGACMRSHMSELMACRSGGAAAASPAEAEAKGVRGVREVCHKEIARYCRHAKGDEALKACLEKNGRKLSGSCKESALASAHRAAAEMHGSVTSAEAACRKDSARLCRGLTFHNGLGPCLKAHHDKVSPKCREAVMGARSMGRSYSHKYGG